ncbi:MAG: arginine--tRNA ligase [Oscillospiraceae bacterium]|jgi:arginyl-tRNA synthetase|nr:arginine--tRNA ligase [Oscillospiraceae bacterium]
MNLIASAREEISDLLTRGFSQSFGQPPQCGEIPLGAPKESAHGDLATSLALSCAKELGMPPRDVADRLVSSLDLDGSFFSGAEIAGPGFINLRYSPRFYADVLDAVDAGGENYGHAEQKTGKRVMVEFVSANPTGPMTIGNARGGVLGDTLASVLAAAGDEVHREFYLNDAGNQVDNFAKSIECRYLEQLGYITEFPEDGYHGEYISDYARAYIQEHGAGLVPDSPEDRRKALAAYALPRAVAAMKLDLARYRVTFDRWFAESTLHASGFVEDTMRMLTEAGHTYEKDGALWLRVTGSDGEKDEVLRKSNGFYTYFAVDLAYHRDKFLKRGFDTVINVLGADHHGHTLRFSNCIEALGVEKQRLRFVLMQMVSLYRDGEVVRMSKRTGKAITLADLLDEIPVDAARFFFNMRSPNTKLDFDLELAVKTTSENPVYYVQYAHARICSLEAALSADGGVPSGGDAALLTHDTEKELIRHIAAFPEEILESAKQLEPSRINRYLTELAGKFHRFYDACRIKDQEYDLRAARFRLAKATRQVLANGLKLLGVDAPVKM